MTRVDLVVPFSDKDEAKSLGARWDPQAKVWYIPEGKEIGPFYRWLPTPEALGLEHEPEFRLRSSSYYLAQSESDCWKCSAYTRVYAFILPEIHEQFQYVDDFEDESLRARNLGCWETPDHHVTVSDVYSISPQVLKQIQLRTDRYKLAFSKTAGSRYYMNHCEHCGVKLGDFFMHSEPGGAFFPTSVAQASKIILRKINERFDANGGVGYATDDFIDCMELIES